MTLKEKYNLVNMAKLPLSETLALAIELADGSEYIFIGITNGNSALALDSGTPIYSELHDIAKTGDKNLAETIFKALYDNKYLTEKHKMIHHNKRRCLGLYDGDIYTVFMLCHLK